MECVPAQGARNRAIRGDQPQVESQQLGNRKGKSVPPSSHQDDLNAKLVGSLERLQVRVGNLKLRIEQGTVNIDGDQSDGKLHHSRF